MRGVAGQLVMTAAAGLVLAACGGAGSGDGSAGAGSTTSAAAATTVVATTAAPPVETTPAPPVETTATPESTAPLTDEQLKAEVIKGYALYAQGVMACAQTPAECNPDEYVVPGGLAAEGLRGFAFTLASAGQRAIPNPAVDRFVVQGFSLADDRKTAELTVCQVDGAVLLDGRGTPDQGDDAVVDDKVYSVTNKWTVVAQGDAWRVLDGILLSKGEGDSCGS